MLICFESVFSTEQLQGGSSVMRTFILETTEHSFDDVPWHGDGERFPSLEACRSRINELAQVPRDNDIAIAVIFSGDMAGLSQSSTHYPRS